MGCYEPDWREEDTTVQISISPLSYTLLNDISYLTEMSISEIIEKLILNAINNHKVESILTDKEDNK